MSEDICWERGVKGLRGPAQGDSHNSKGGSLTTELLRFQGDEVLKLTCDVETRDGQTLNHVTPPESRPV